MDTADVTSLKHWLMSMVVDDPLAQESLAELEIVFRWLQERGDDPKEPMTVLIGGWAVYSYNKYYGSIDIDLVTNNRTRTSLMYYLRKEHGYRPDRFLGRTSVSKKTEHGKVIIDFGTRDRADKFEGKDKSLDFTILDGNTEVKDFSGVGVPVPTRSLLILFKLKAVWDREYRIRHDSSHDVEWERAKLVKDYADILALVDPKKGGHDIDIEFLGTMLDEFPFLGDYLEKAKENLGAIGKYETTPKEAREFIDKLVALL